MEFATRVGTRRIDAAGHRPPYGTNQRNTTRWGGIRTAHSRGACSLIPGHFVGHITTLRLELAAVKAHT